MHYILKKSKHLIITFTPLIILTSATRVIIRSPHVGAEFMNKTTYTQMIGRAGRAGYDNGEGESFVIVKPNLKQKVSLFHIF